MRPWVAVRPMPKSPVQALRTGVPSGTPPPEEEDAACELDDPVALVELLEPVALDALDALAAAAAPPVPPPLVDDDCPEVSCEVGPEQAATPSGARRAVTPSEKRQARVDDITGPLLQRGTGRQHVENSYRRTRPVHRRGGAERIPRGDRSRARASIDDDAHRDHARTEPAPAAARRRARRSADWVARRRGPLGRCRARAVRRLPREAEAREGATTERARTRADGARSGTT